MLKIKRVGAAMPAQTTLNVLSIQACTSEGAATHHMHSVPNIACWKIRAVNPSISNVASSPS